MKNVSNARPSIIDANQNFRAGKEVLNSKTDEFSHMDNFERALLSKEVISKMKQILQESD